MVLVICCTEIKVLVDCGAKVDSALLIVCGTAVDVLC